MSFLNNVAPHITHISAQIKQEQAHLSEITGTGAAQRQSRKRLVKNAPDRSLRVAVLKEVR
jgi:hypothetical protein